MFRLSRMLSLIVAICVGCGEEAEKKIEVAVTLVANGTDPTTILAGCNERATIGANLQTSLVVAGHEPCGLNVDAVSLDATGRCGQITTGVVRPLALVHRFQHPFSSNNAYLVELISWVDLTSHSLKPGVTEVSVVPNPSSGRVLYRNSDVDSLPDFDPLNDDNQRAAERWSKHYFYKMEANFDFDRDGLSNLEEACDGTLFP